MAEKKSSKGSKILKILLILVLIVIADWFYEKPPPEEFSYGGLPRAAAHPCKNIEVLENTGFTIGYCEEKQNPVWVVYRVFDIADAKSFERPRHFVVDERTEARVTHKDYTKSGYDRGHMAPNHAIETRYGREAQLQTFLMSNICPQKPDLNRRVWKKLEQKIAKDYADRLEEVWVITGPVFDDKIENLKSGVEIPDAFFKIIVDSQAGELRTKAYLMPQDVKGDESLDRFLVSIDEIERLTALDFLSEFDDSTENRLESTASRTGW